LINNYGLKLHSDEGVKHKGKGLIPFGGVGSRPEKK
jgi:hypothetical protein